VRRAAYLPDASDLTDSDLLGFADESMEALLGAAIKSGREGHWLTTTDVTIVTGTISYRLPRRAYARALRGLILVSPEGYEIPMEQVDAFELRALYAPTSTAQGTPYQYAFEGDFVRIGCTPSSAGWSLRFSYLARPSSLIAVSSCGPITLAASTTLFKTPTPVPSGFVIGAWLDIIRGTEPFETLYTDRIVADVTGGDITLETSTPIVVADVQSLTVDGERDYACPRDRTCLPQIPGSFWGALVADTARQCLGALRDSAGEASMQARTAQRLSQAVSAAEPRDQRSTQLIRGAGFYRRRGR
jgi:hypothetical protein